MPQDQDHRVRFSTINPDGCGGITESDVAYVRQADIGACPHLIMVAAHYRPDGSCKCDDPEEQAMMIRKWGYSRRDFRRARKA